MAKFSLQVSATYGSFLLFSATALFLFQMSWAGFAPQDDDVVDNNASSSCTTHAAGSSGTVSVGGESGGEGISLLALRSKVQKELHSVQIDEVGPRRARQHSSLAQEQARGRLGRRGGSDVELLGKGAAKGRGRGAAKGQHGGRSTGQNQARLQVALKVSSAKRKSWIEAQRMMEDDVEHTAQDMENFVQTVKDSQDSCSKKTLTMFSKIREETTHAKAMSEQLVAHETVLTSTTRDLNATMEAMDDAEAVYQRQLEECAHARAEAAEKFVEYTNELAELEAISNPEVRAEIAEHTVEEHPELVDSEENATLLQVASEKNKRPGGRSGQRLQQHSHQKQRHAWSSKSQCVAFLHYQAKVKHKRMAVKHKAKKARQPENTTVTFPAKDTAAEAGIDTAECDTQLLDLQNQFQTAYTDLQDMAAHAEQEKDSHKCDELAKTERDAELVPLTTQREDATTKIESSEAAAAALLPVINLMHDQIEGLKHEVKVMKEECTEIHVLSTHLTAVSDLIVSTMACPGIGDVDLPIPDDICHTNGQTCSWKCSDEGYIFASGFYYGYLNSDWGAPPENTHEGRAYCERKCIENVHCVAFVHDWKWQGCNFMFDVVDGSFKEAPEYPEKERWACYIEERVDSVNRHRDPDHPKMDHTDIEEYWWEYENYYYWDDWDGEGYDDYYEQYHQEGHSVLDDAGSSGDQIQYVGPDTDQANDVPPTEQDILEVLSIGEDNATTAPTTAVGNVTVF